MTLLYGLDRFVYDFIVGDDWKIATAVLSTRLIGALLLTLGVPASVTAGLLAAAFTTAMVIDIRRLPGHRRCHRDSW
jgi:hypothetical protein